MHHKEGGEGKKGQGVGAAHKTRTAHVCKPFCRQYPCSPLPKEVLSDSEEDDVDVATSTRRRMLRLSAMGHFSQAPPVKRKAPCGFHWRRTTVKAPVYNHVDTTEVDLCVWHCTRAGPGNCCSLQPELLRLYFQAPSDMRISHFTLSDDVDEIYCEGATFQSIQKRAERRARRRKGKPHHWSCLHNTMML